MIRVSNGKIELSKSRELSPKQIKRLESLSSEQDRKAYLLSCLGLQRARNLPIHKVKADGLDALTLKDKGHYSHLFNMAKRNGANIDHKPLERGRWIGVEVECLIPSEGRERECPNCEGSGHDTSTCETCEGEGRVTNADGARVACSDCGGEGFHEIDCETCEGRGRIESDDDDDSSLHESIREALREAKVCRASVRSDGSLRGEGMIGVEVTILLNTDNGWQPLERALDVLRSQFRAEVNKTCGLHVHFDFRKAGKDAALEAGKRLERALPALALMVPESRRDNTYCKLALSKFDGCRYHAVNLTSFKKHGSLEVRLHGGTLDARKIEHWVTLLRLIMARPRPARGESVRDLQGLLDAYQVPDSLVGYLDERWQKFNAEAIARAERAEREARASAEAQRAMASAPVPSLQSAPDAVNALLSMPESAGISQALISRGIESETMRAIAIMVSRGESNAEIDEALRMPSGHAQAFLSAIYAALGIESRAQLIVWCLPHIGATAQPLTQEAI